MTQWTGTRTLGAALFVFVAGAGLGRYVATHTAPASAATAPALDAGPVYKIPVSVSQARRGPAEALVTIVQWCDFPDAGCAALEPALAEVMAAHPGDVSLVFRHFLSAERADSAAAHQFSRAAFEHAGKFWEARELLLRHPGAITPADLERFAGELGMDWAATKRAIDAGTFSGPVAADRMFAQMFDVSAAPALFVNGRRVTPLDGAHLRTLVDAELARAKRVVENGVQRADVYAELTKNGVWTPPERTAEAH